MTGKFSNETSSEKSKKVASYQCSSSLLLKISLSSRINRGEHSMGGCGRRHSRYVINIEADR